MNFLTLFFLMMSLFLGSCTKVPNTRDNASSGNPDPAESEETGSENNDKEKDKDKSDTNSETDNNKDSNPTGENPKPNPVSIIPKIEAGEDLASNRLIILRATATDAVSYNWEKVSGPGEIMFADPKSITTNVSASMDGVYRLKITATSTSGHFTSDQLTLVWDTLAPTITLSSDLRAFEPFILSATVNGASSYLWEKVSGPGNVTFSAPTALSTTFSADADGSYIVRLTAKDALDNTDFKETTIIWNTSTPMVSAGADRITNASTSLTATASIDASYQWTKVSGPGTISFSSPNALVTNVQASQQGTYVLRITATSTGGKAVSDELTLTWDTAAPTVANIADISSNIPVTLSPTVTNANSFAWSQVSGPGTITFGSDNSNTTTVSASADGSYVIRLTATDTAGNSTSKNGNFTWDTTAPVIGAVADILTKSTVTVSPSVSGASTYAWLTLTGPVPISFGNPNAGSTTLTATADGTYVLQLTATDAVGNSSNQSFNFTWDATAPTIDPVASIATRATTTIAPTVTGANSCSWSKISGSGTITFGSANACSSTVQASVDGSYVLRLTADDAAGNSASRDISFSWDTTAPSIETLNSILSYVPVTVAPTVTGATTYDWSQISGPGTINFASPTSSATLVSASADGGYVIRLSASDAIGNTATRDFSFNWDTTAPEITLADTFNVTGKTINLSPSVIGGNTYFWEVVSNPGAAIIESPYSLSTSITVDTAGTYVFVFGSLDQAFNITSKEITVVFDFSFYGKAIYAGGNHTCALLPDNSVKCWGLGSSGQLGYGNTNSLSKPAAAAINLGTNRTATALALGYSHTCALLDDSTIKCWGEGYSGALGNGSSSNVTAPGAAIDVGFGKTVKAVAAGQTHTCVILNDDAVKCWGSGSSGELGYGIETGLTAPPTEIVNLGSGKTALAIAAGAAHTCAILNDGSVKCWGSGSSGQLGYGNNSNLSTPDSNSVDLGYDKTAKAIAAGYYHSCALLNDDTVKCWGDGSLGQLGYGNNNNLTAPASSTIYLGSGKTAKSIIAGNFHSCAILNDDTVKCWGANNYGSLGYGNSLNLTAPSATAINLGTGNTALSIAAGRAHTCALLNDNKVKCWGDRSNGQLGLDINTKLAAPSPIAVDIGAGNAALSVTSGNAHSCVRLSDNQVKCWGLGTDGQLGNGNTVSLSTPSSNTIDMQSNTALAIAAGYAHTCAFLNNNSVKCWGLGGSGQLGVVSLANILSPASTAINLGSWVGLREIAAGHHHTCAILDNNSVKCWGAGSNGQLGIGSIPLVDTPYTAVNLVTLGVVKTAKALAAGSAHTCALLNDDTVKCWGLGLSGQLGNNSTSSLLTPSLISVVTLGQTAKAIAAGANHTCAILNDNTVRCWGENGNGQLGNSGTTNLSTPAVVDLGSGKTALAITAGGAHTCALLNDSTVKCWGSGTSGQLGNGTLTDTNTPSSTLAFSGLSAISISAGATHTCAVLNDNSVRCWGLGDSGQLGYKDAALWEPHTNAISYDSVFTVSK